MKHLSKTIKATALTLCFAPVAGFAETGAPLTAKADGEYWQETSHQNTTETTQSRFTTTTLSQDTTAYKVYDFNNAQICDAENSTTTKQIDRWGPFDETRTVTRKDGIQTVQHELLLGTHKETRHYNAKQNCHTMSNAQWNDTLRKIKAQAPKR